MVKSLRLLIFPILGMGCSLCLSFAAGALTTYVTSVMAFLPSLLMSLVIALSFDYALFLSLRYREELLNRKTRGADDHEGYERVVSVVVESAGHTIFVSGLILSITFVTMAFFPVPFVRTTGLVSAVSILLSVCINLVITPSILLTFPSFFEKSVEPFAICGR